MNDHALMLGMLESLLDIISNFEDRLEGNDRLSYLWIKNQVQELRSWDDKTNPDLPV